MDNKSIEQLILAKGIFETEENLRIYNKFFCDWAKQNEYIYRRFNIRFTDKLLDIGCQYGHNLIHFNKESLGLEAQDKLVKFALGLGLRVKTINVEDGLGDLGEKFDFIWCSDFLVHMVSPYKLLYDCRRLLNDKGRLMIQIPLMSILGKHKTGCHFYAFDKKSLVYLLEMAGFRVIKTSGCVRRLPHWVNKIFEPIFQRFGSNIWVLAEKAESRINWNDVFLPQWFKR